jgi:hypothetical protein
MDYIKYYREQYLNDLHSFRQQIPIVGNKHYSEDIFNIQYFQLTPSYNFLDFVKDELAQFAVSLFFSVLFDQVAYNQQIKGGNYSSFQKLTNYPKFIGNCTSVSEKFSQCGQNQHPILLLKAINDYEDEGNSFEFDRLLYQNAEKQTKRSIIQYSGIFYKALIFFKNEAKTFFESTEINMSWSNFWTQVDIECRRNELASLLKKY